MDIEARLKSLRRKPLVPLSELPHNLRERGGSDLPPRLLPHRPPMLLVDRVDGVDLDQELIHGSRLITDDHIGLRGHFPRYAVLPGTIQIEMLGQLALCLYAFLNEGTLELPDEIPTLNIRATKILGAHFLDEIRPGDRVELIARVLERDDFLGTCVAQAIVDRRICCVMAGEVCFLD